MTTRKKPQNNTKGKSATKKITPVEDFYTDGYEQVWLSVDGMKRKLAEVLEIARTNDDALTMEAAFNLGGVYRLDAYRWRKNNPELDPIFKQIKSAISVRRYNGAAKNRLNARVILPTQHFYCNEYATLHATQRKDTEIRLQALDKGQMSGQNAVKYIIVTKDSN